MLGQVNGGAVRLVEPPRGAVWPLVVAEASRPASVLASGLLSGSAAVWAALSAWGIRSLRLPPEPGRLTIASDGDKAGREAATELGRRARAEGWQVFLLDAP
jgi:hypothetical protein